MSAGPKVPSKATLRRYGITLAEWLAMVEAQGNVCAICRKLPPSGVLCVDHDHGLVPRWKHQAPEVRKTAVRGLLCVYDNLRMLPRGMTLEKARAIAAYLEAFDAKVASLPKPVSTPKPKRPTKTRKRWGDVIAFPVVVRISDPVLLRAGGQR